MGRGDPQPGASRRGLRDRSFPAPLQAKAAGPPLGGGRGYFAPRLRPASLPPASSAHCLCRRPPPPALLACTWRGGGSFKKKERETGNPKRAHSNAGPFAGRSIPALTRRAEGALWCQTSAGQGSQRPPATAAGVGRGPRATSPGLHKRWNPGGQEEPAWRDPAWLRRATFPEEAGASLTGTIRREARRGGPRALQEGRSPSSRAARRGCARGPREPPPARLSRAAWEVSC